MTTQQLCTAMDISETTAARWAREGCPHRRTPKEAFRWELKAVQAWRKATVKSPVPADPDFLKARARKETALAEKHELDLAKRKGDVLDRKETHRFMFTVIRQARDGFLALPDRLAGILAAESDQHTVHQTLTAEIRRVLEDLAKQFSQPKETA